MTTLSIQNAAAEPSPDLFWDFRPYAAKCENASELQSLADNYRLQFQPRTQEERCLLTFVILAQWNKHRWMRYETQLLDEFPNPLTLLKDPAANALLKQIERRISAEDRRFHRSLSDLRKVQKSRGAAKPPTQPTESKPVTENWVPSAQFADTPAPPADGPAKVAPLILKS